jgi:tripartite-type tricarboxylate transporter receptor subunit TctC
MTIIKPTRRQVIAGVGGGAAVMGLNMIMPKPVWSQTFPSRPVRWICYQAPGGTMDTTIRAYQPFLAKYGGDTQIEYLQGGSGNIARTEVYNAEPDGYTMMMEANPGAVFGEVVAGAAYEAREFEPIFGWSIDGWQLCTQIDGEIRDVDDLVRIANERTLTAATIGRGSTTHLQLLVLQEALGIDFNIVHFNGTGEAYPQVIGGNVDFAVGGPGSGARSRDNLHIFATFRAEREALLQDVPTMAEQGYDNVPSIDQTWYVSATPGIPADRLEVLTNAFREGFEDPEFAEAQERAGLAALTPLEPDQLREIVNASFDLAQQYRDVLSA